MLSKGAEICGVNVWHPGFWGVCARSGSVNDRPSAMGARDGAVMRCRLLGLRRRNLSILGGAIPFQG